MKTLAIRLAVVALALGATPRLASAQNPHDPHPTMTAAHRFGKRKVAHAAHVTQHAGKHLHNWQHRKAHNTRAWLNKH